MKLIVKKLQGEEINLEVLPTTTVIEIKRHVAEQLNIPVDQQKLLLLGRTLADDQTIQQYPSIKDGTKLNLVVKKPEGLLEASTKYFKNLGMSDAAAAHTANRFIKVLEEKFNKLSWDDVDRLCLDCMLDEYGESRPPPCDEPEPECDDMFGL